MYDRKVLQILYTSGNVELYDAPNFLQIQKLWVVQYPYFLHIGFQGHFFEITLAKFYLSLKIRKSHGSTGF